jgi:hypothetical protein
MKVQLTINENEKSIRVDEVISLGELFEKLETLLPNGVWKEFKLESTSMWPESWRDPIIIPQPYPVYPPVPVTPVSPRPYLPYLPWWESPFIVTCNTNQNSPFCGSSDVVLKYGIYNIQI